MYLVIDYTFMHFVYIFFMFLMYEGDITRFMTLRFCTHSFFYNGLMMNHILDRN